MKFVKLETLKHDVFKRGKVVIPAGSKNVEVAYRAANWTFKTEDGTIQRGNVYRYNGKIY